MTKFPTPTEAADAIKLREAERKRRLLDLTRDCVRKRILVGHDCATIDLPEIKGSFSSDPDS